MRIASLTVTYLFFFRLKTFAKTLTLESDKFLDECFLIEWVVAQLGILTEKTFKIRLMREV